MESYCENQPTLQGAFPQAFKKHTTGYFTPTPTPAIKANQDAGRNADFENKASDWLIPRRVCGQITKTPNRRLWSTAIRNIHPGGKVQGRRPHPPPAPILKAPNYGLVPFIRIAAGGTVFYRHQIADPNGYPPMQFIFWGGPPTPGA